MTNRALAAAFVRAADLLEIAEANPFRIRSYRRAAQTIQNAPFAVGATARTEPEKVQNLPGIGKATFQRILELEEEGRSHSFQELEREVPASLLELLELQNLGPRKIALLWRELGIVSLSDLTRALEEGRLSLLKGFGARTTANLRQAIAAYQTRSGRTRIDHAQETAEVLIAELIGGGEFGQVVYAGSLRRARETVGDLDLLATASASRPSPHSLSLLTTHPSVSRVRAAGETKASVVWDGQLQIDLRLVSPDEFGAALQYFTGSQAHNVRLRERAKRMGLKISEYGVFRVQDGEKIAGESEESVYAAMGLAWIPPELREDRGEIDLAQQGSLPRLVEVSDLKGDLHMHTRATDGRNSLVEMASAAREEGYDYIAITDHSKSLAMTGGLDESRLLSQVREIEELRAGSPDLHVLSGIEVDILADGSLDLSDEVLAGLDLVIASVHTRLNLSREEMTRRVCRAISNPHVNILAHPTGRLLLKRDPYPLDLDRVIRTAVDHRVCLELNSHPSRLDLGPELLRKATDMGALIAVNSDSHSIRGFSVVEFGIRTARRAWLTREDLLNTRSLPDLKATLRKESYR